jgi:hypothetical protein
MSFNPFFEPENMSDDELTNKLNELRRRLYMGSYSQSSVQLMQGLQNMIRQIEEVQQGRLMIQAQEAWHKMFPDVIESDPEVKQKRQEEAAGKQAGKPGPKKRLATQEIFHKEYLNQPPKKDEGTK